MEKIIYFIVASAFIGTKLFSIDIRIMQLSLYRISLFAMTFYLLLDNFLLDKKVKIRIKDRQSLIIRFYLFWSIYCAYSLIWSIDLKNAIKALFFIGTGFLCIIVFSTFVKKEKTFRGIFNTIFTMIVLHNILGWFELETGKYLFTDVSIIDKYNQYGHNKAARLPLTMFSNPNDFGTLMTLGVFISFIVLLNSKRLWLKALSFLTMSSSALLVIRSASRANMVGMMLGIGAILFLVILKRLSKSVIILLGLSGIGGIILYAPLRNKIISVVSNRILSTFGSQSASVGSDQTRLNLIKNGLVFLLNTVGFGTGGGNIEYWMAMRPVYNVGKILNVHNWWVEILVGYGVFVFVAYVFIYILKTQTLFTAYLKSSKPFIKNTSLGLFGFMIAFIISSVSSSSNINNEWLWLFWGVLVSFIGYIVVDFKDSKVKSEVYDNSKGIS